MSTFTQGISVAAACCVFTGAIITGQQPPAPPAPDRDPLTPAPARRTDEGKGPFKTLVIRGAMLIDGTGAPPQGPVDIVAAGMYVLPGFVDLHAHAGGAPKNAEAEYAYKLWLAHGVTTVRGVPLTGNSLAVREKQRSEKNEIAAPRIVNYQRPG